jgi:hypothetical protein
MNGDGTLDLYCASHLFLNDGAGHFTDVRAQVGLPAVFDEGAKFVDIDSDGDLDLYLRTASGPRLFRNEGGMFTEVTAAAGLPGRPFFWGDSWADVDNDGDVDLLLVNTSPYAMELYLNQGNGTFVSDTAFAAARYDNFLSAWADAAGRAARDDPVEHRLDLIRGRVPGCPQALVCGQRVSQVAAEHRVLEHQQLERLPECTLQRRLRHLALRVRG